MLIDLPGRWQLMQATIDKDKWYVWHKHGAGNHHWTSSCMVYRDGAVCSHCDTPMPDEIGGFIQLLEWER